MRVPKKRCAHCRAWFQPDHRRAAVQTFCSRPGCRRQSRLESHRAWWRRDGAGTDAARRSKHRDWTRASGYWRRYRADHADYVRRDNERRRKAKRAALRAANQDIRRRISVGKLMDIRAGEPEKAANQDMIHRRVDGILDFLLWKEGAANQDVTDVQAVSA